MSLFFETLKVENGVVYHVEFHNQRLNRTVSEIFHIQSTIDLRSIVIPPDRGSYRCKVIYAQTIESVVFFPYIPRIFESFKITHTKISYPYKSVDRSEINKLFEEKGNCDDILMIKEDLVCDTSIANIALYDGTRWLTPKTPLLAGTQRAKLLKDKIIFEKDIKVKDINKFQSFALMNALLGFYEIRQVKFYH